MMKQFVAPLPVKEQISAYDYSGSLDSIFVATNHLIAIYGVDELRKPKTLFNFDHFHEISRIRAQHVSNPLVSTVDTCAVNLWDVEKNSKPLIDILSFKSRIKDFRWSRHSTSCFMMGTADGVVSSWDVRMGTKCANQFSVGRKVCQSIKLSSSNSNLGALLADNKFIVVWDARMLSNQTKGIVAERMHDFYQVIEVEEGIADFHWHWCQPSIWTITSKGKIDLTKIDSTDSHLTQNREKIEKRAIGNPAAVCWAINPHPDGHGAIVQQRDMTKNVSVINYINFKNQSSSEEYEIAKSSNKLFFCKWRGTLTNPTSMITLSTTGLVHLFDWNSPRKTPSTDQLSAFGSTASLASTKSNVSTVAAPVKSKYSWEEIQPTFGTDDIEATLPRLSDQTNMDSEKNRLVVGPKTFAALLSDEIALLQKARRLGKMDGIRVESMDHFQRQLVLELLVPMTDPFSIAAKRVAFYATNYYKTEELRVFYKGNTNQTVALTLTFHHKMSKFWQPKFLVENRSEFKFDMQYLSKYVLDGLEEVLKMLPSHYSNPPNNNSANNTGNTSTTATAASNIAGKYNSPNPGNNADYSSSFIFLVAKCFRKRVLKTWTRVCDTGNFNDSIRRSLQPEKAQGLTDSENETNKPPSSDIQDGLELRGDTGKEQGDYLDLSSLPVTDPYVKLALRTPFPALSMGIFNSKGELVLLGNAEIAYNSTPSPETSPPPVEPRTDYPATPLSPSLIQPPSTTTTTVKADCYYVNGIAKSVYNPSYAQKRTLAEQRIAYRQPHLSYANLMMNRLSALKPAVSEGKISTMSSSTVLDNVSTSSSNLVHSASNPKFVATPGSSHHGSHHGINGARFSEDDYQISFEESNDYSSPSYPHHGTKGANITRSLSGAVTIPRNPAFSHGSGHYRNNSHPNQNQDDVIYWEESNNPSYPSKLRADSYFSEVSTTTRNTMSNNHSHHSQSAAGAAAQNNGVASSSYQSNGFMGPSSFHSVNSHLSHHHRHHGQSGGHYASENGGNRGTTANALFPIMHHTPHKILTHIKLCKAFPQLDYHLACALQLGPLITTFAETTTTHAAPQHAEYLQARIQACQKNAALLQHYVPTDYGLIQCWNLLAVSLEVYAVIDNGGLITWSNSVLGRSLFNQLILYLVQIQNVSLLATIICILGDSRSVVRLWSTPHIPYLTRDDNPEDVIENTVLYFEHILYTYADILRRWGELGKATEVTKHMSLKGILEKKKFDISSARNSTVSFTISCMLCGNKASDGLNQHHPHHHHNNTTTASLLMNKHYSNSVMTNTSSASTNYHAKCMSCQRYANYCTVCLQPVRRMTSICDRCGHGGHEDHLSQWFGKHTQCPTGCGCRCRSAPSIMSQDEFILFEDPSDPIMSSMYPVTKKSSSLYQDIPFHSNRHYFEEISLGNNFLSEYNYNNFYDTL